MKKYGLLIMLLGLLFCVQGCGFDDGGEDLTVTIIKATPTPEPTPTPEVVATPEPTPTPEPVAVVEQTASGVNITKVDGAYSATVDLNLRADCSTEAELLGSVPSGTVLTSTGTSDNGWIQLSYNGTVCYAMADYLTPADPATAVQ